MFDLPLSFDAYLPLQSGTSMWFVHRYSMRIGQSIRPSPSFPTAFVRCLPSATVRHEHVIRAPVQHANQSESLTSAFFPYPCTVPRRSLCWPVNLFWFLPPYTLNP